MRSVRRSHWRGFILLLVLPWMLPGCAPVPPLDRPVQAETPADYRQWLHRHAKSLGPRAERELHAAVQQLGLRLQLEQRGASPEALTRAVHARLHGLSAREIITEAHLWSWQNLAAQNAVDDQLFERNATYPFTPDVAPAILERFREQLEQIRQRQAGRRAEMARLEARLRELNPGVDLNHRLIGPVPPEEAAPSRPASRPI
jgi:hypothetical protein